MNGKERCAIIVTHSSEAASHGDEVLGLMVKCMVLNDKKSLRAQGLGTWSARESRARGIEDTEAGKDESYGFGRYGVLVFKKGNCGCAVFTDQYFHRLFCGVQKSIKGAEENHLEGFFVVGDFHLLSVRCFRRDFLQPRRQLV